MYKISTYGWVKYFDFIILDLLMVAVSFFVAFFFRHGWINPFSNAYYVQIFVIILVLDLILFILTDSLQDILKRGYYKEFIATVKHALLLLAFLFALIFLIKQGELFSRMTIIGMILMYIVLSYLVRLIWRHFRKKSKHRDNTSMLILTNARLVDDLLERIDSNNFGEYQVVGLVFNDVDLVGMKVHGIPVVAAIENAADFIKQNWVDEVLISLDSGVAFPDDLITDCITMGVTVHLNMVASRSTMGCRQMNGNIAGNYVTTFSLNVMTPFQAFVKRTLDIIGALFGCILTGVLAIFIVPAIKKESPGPALYKQTRIGKNGKTFTMYKFRSMYMDANERKNELMAQNEMKGLMFKMSFDPRVIGNKLVDGEERTGIGDFIRRHSLDEFPQFFNVLKGDMSLVGTRPPTEDEFKFYETHHRIRLATVPGLTGLWQISGRSDINDFEAIVMLDTEYINTWNFGKDIKIILQTIGMVFKPKGAV